LVVAVLLGAGGLIRLGLLGSSVSPRTHHQTGSHWVATWAASPQNPIPANMSPAGFRDQTIRQIVFSSAGGSMVRVRLTNAFGSRPLMIGRAAIAIQQAGAELTAGTSRELFFAGQPSVRIAPGAEVLSDPVSLEVRPLTHLAVSIFVPDRTGPATEHSQARQVNYVATGNHTVAGSAGPFATQTQSWYFLDGVDLLSPAQDLGAVVTLGDSITDGVGSATNANARWPNELARRFAARPGATLSVIDEGISGNRVLNDSACCGVSAVARFERDVLGPPGVRDVIVLEGINDIGYSSSRGLLSASHTNVSALQIVDGYARLIALAHAAGLKIFGATLTPFRGAGYWTPTGEAKREAVNRWLRASGAFDGVIDFARALADPAHPQQLAPAFDSGDHLHPNSAGYRVMAGAVNLAALLRR
jgi:lysophospholipase L1-like esterase